MSLSRLTERAIETAEQRATEQPRATKRTPLRHKTAGRAVTDSVCVHFCHSSLGASVGALRSFRPADDKIRLLVFTHYTTRMPILSISYLMYFPGLRLFAIYSPPRKSGCSTRLSKIVSSWPSRRLCLASPAPEAHNSARGSTGRSSSTEETRESTMGARYII